MACAQVSKHPDITADIDVILVDGDVLVYEMSFGAEYKDDEGNKQVRDFDFVEEQLVRFLDYLRMRLGCEDIEVFLTGKDNFRKQLATTQPYKGQRGEKPFHYQATRTWLELNTNCVVAEGMEADDLLGIVQTDNNLTGVTSIICSRDKDLKQIEGWHYSWEVGYQKEAVVYSSYPGSLTLHESGNKKKLRGDGIVWFYAQLIMGDRVDNIPGLPKMGDVAAYNALHECTNEQEMFSVVRQLYHNKGFDDSYLMEQAKLLWMCKETNPDGTPVMYYPPLELEE